MNNLKHYRITVDANQKQIGDIVGVEQCSIVRYENGTREVSLKMAWRLVKALKSLGAECSFEDVFPEPIKQNQAG